MKQMKETLAEKNALLHIDFAENYLCKYFQKVVQSFHSGGNRDQVSMHAGVLYKDTNLQSFHFEKFRKTLSTTRW